MFIDDEKRIISQYVYNDKTFRNGISNFELFIFNNLNEIKDIERLYKYNYDDEKRHLYIVYERIVLFIVNLYFAPNHKTERKYMRNSELYLAYYIFLYFTDVFDNKRTDELKYYTINDNYDYSTNTFNDTGIFALKLYLASIICLNKNGLIADYYIDCIKESIKNNQMPKC